MTSTTRRGVAAVCAIGLLCVLGRSAAAQDHCFYKGSMYSDGATACQSGTQYRCDDGQWRGLGLSCEGGAVVLSRTCQLRGISFSTGSASCQSGTQFRCEDGAWRSLGIPCTVGDSPIKPSPSGRTCMFDGATVASSSTICRSGSTFLCNDGEWINLGTLCR